MRHGCFGVRFIFIQEEANKGLATTEHRLETSLARKLLNLALPLPPLCSIFLFYSSLSFPPPLVASINYCFPLSYFGFCNFIFFFLLPFQFPIKLAINVHPSSKFFRALSENSNTYFDSFSLTFSFSWWLFFFSLLLLLFSSLLFHFSPVVVSFFFLLSIYH